MSKSNFPLWLKGGSVHSIENIIDIHSDQLSSFYNIIPHILIAFKELAT